jgi:hypothetical protein
MNITILAKESLKFHNPTYKYLYHLEVMDEYYMLALKHLEPDCLEITNRLCL